MMLCRSSIAIRRSLPPASIALVGALSRARKFDQDSRSERPLLRPLTDADDTVDDRAPGRFGQIMSGAFEANQLCTRDRIVNRLAVRVRQDLVVVTLNHERRYTGLREQLPPICRLARADRHRMVVLRGEVLRAGYLPRGDVTYRIEIWRNAAGKTCEHRRAHLDLLLFRLG